jgi:hypothetical protein
MAHRQISEITAARRPRGSDTRQYVTAFEPPDFWLEMTRSTETITMRIGGRGTETSEPLGSLAARVLKSMAEKDMARDVHRLFDWYNERLMAARVHTRVEADIMTRELAVARDQLFDWKDMRRPYDGRPRDGQIDLGRDGAFGPTAAIGRGRFVWNQITWLEPSGFSAKLARTSSPSALVLASLVVATMTGRLFACRSCGRLIARASNSQERRKRCRGCANPAAIRRRAPALQRQQQRVIDRLRHDGLSPPDYRAGQHRCNEVMNRYHRNELTAIEASAALEKIRPTKNDAGRPLG